MRHSHTKFWCLTKSTSQVDLDGPGLSLDHSSDPASHLLSAGEGQGFGGAGIGTLARPQ